jgi:hypothetical protein
VDNYIEIAVGFVVAVVVVWANVVWVRWHSSRSRAVLNNWAERHRFEILYCERQLFFLGPFFMTTFRRQVVYKVRVRNGHGKVRAGLVTCGGPFCPFVVDEATVKWEGGLG